MLLQIVTKKCQCTHLYEFLVYMGIMKWIVKDVTPIIMSLLMLCVVIATLLLNVHTQLVRMSQK